MGMIGHHRLDTCAALLFLNAVQVRCGGRTILNDLTLSVARGSIVAIVGPSGAGKTTLLRVINGLATIAAGSIHFPKPSGAMSAVGQWPRSGTIFQDHALIGRLSAMDNVMLGLVDQRPLWSFAFSWPLDIQRRAALALAEMELLEHAHYPVRQLSGGERQRVAIARALIRDPVLLLADEPFASVDPVLRAKLSDLVVASVRARGATMLIVLHDLQTVMSIADHVIGLNNGRIVFNGPLQHFDSAAYKVTYGAEPALGRVSAAGDRNRKEPP